MTLYAYYWHKVSKRLNNYLRNFRWWLRARFSNETLTDDEFLSATQELYKSKEEFLKHIIHRKDPYFFLPKNKEELIPLILDVFPDYKDSSIDGANQICNHVFDLLGSGKISLGTEIDWHTDFISGHQWKADQYFALIHESAYPGGYDIKVPWELSRFQHFVWLGQAYMFTNEEIYAQEFVAEVEDWIKKNPYPGGVNWSTSMEVAIRAINWLWGFYYFRTSKELSQDFVIDFFKSLLIHARHIQNNLEVQKTKQGLLKSNHYLANIVGLFYLGTLLPEFKEAKSWHEFAKSELENEIINQVYDDGMDFEASISYHRLVTECFLFSALISQINGHDFSETYMNRVEKMLEFIMDITKPDGTVPMIGDNDNGRIHRLKMWDRSDLEWKDYRYLLAIGSVLFDRMDFAVAAGDQWEEAFWLCGESAYNMWARIQETSETTQYNNSAAYTDAGIFIMRKHDAYLIVDAGKNGQNGLGGHAHNDVFSFELYFDQTQWIVDPGTYTYTSDYLARNLFRRTSSHNTVMIDGIEQNTLNPKAPFWLGSESDPKVEVWKTGETFDYLAASHAGYHRLRQPITHHRRIFFNKENSPWWLIQDYFEGTGTHEFVWSYQVMNHDIEVLDNGFVLLNQNNKNLAFLFLDNKPEMAVEEGWYSSSYGIKSKIPVVRARLRAGAPVAMTLLIHPIDEKIDISVLHRHIQSDIFRACESLLDIQFSSSS